MLKAIAQASPCNCPVPVINGYADITYIPVQSDDDTEPEILEENGNPRYVEYVRASYNYGGKYVDTDKNDYKWKYYGTSSKWTGINVLARNTITLGVSLPMNEDEEPDIYQCSEIYPEVLDIIRISFEIQTQVSTSRELNRVSPNNICEQSTRYCNFANEKFGEDIAFCEPHWLDATTFYDTVNNEEIEKESEIFRKREDGKIVAFCNGKCLTVGDKYPIATKGIPQKDGSSLLYNPITIGKDYIEGLLDDEQRYFKYIKYGMKPQDARGILGLDVATKCFYTYSIKEWKHILDLRYKGTTGDPHPNAKIIAEEIYNKLKELNLLGNYE